MGVCATLVDIQNPPGAIVVGGERESFENLETLDRRNRSFQSLNSTFLVGSFMYANNTSMVRMYMIFTPFKHTLSTNAGSNTGITRTKKL
jgi:hypothetical protein